MKSRTEPAALFHASRCASTDVLAMHAVEHVSLRGPLAQPRRLLTGGRRRYEAHALATSWSTPFPPPIAHRTRRTSGRTRARP